VQPIVSVIMPAYNTEKFIGESIQSVVDQTYTNWELLVVDDGSTDKTADIIRSFAAQDSRVKYLFQQNGRQAKARNTAIEHSHGKSVPAGRNRPTQESATADTEGDGFHSILVLLVGGYPPRWSIGLQQGTLVLRSPKGLCLLGGHGPLATRGRAVQVCRFWREIEQNEL